MTDHVIIGSFIENVCKQLFSRMMIIMILKGGRSYIEGRYKSKRSMTFSKLKRRSRL